MTNSIIKFLKNFGKILISLCLFTLETVISLPIMSITAALIWLEGVESFFQRLKWLIIFCLTAKAVLHLPATTAFVILTVGFEVFVMLEKWLENRLWRAFLISIVSCAIIFGLTHTVFSWLLVGQIVFGFLFISLTQSTLLNRLFKSRQTNLIG